MLPNTGCCPKLNPDEDAVVVLLPNKDPWPKPGLDCPNTGAVFWPKSPVPVLAAELVALAAKEKELALFVLEDPNSPPPPLFVADVVEAAVGCPNPELALNAG